MLAKRIVPCLDIKDGTTVKGINFVNFRDAGDPVELGAQYSDQGADELVYLDITASHEGRKTFTELVKKVAARISVGHFRHRYHRHHQLGGRFCRQRRRRGGPPALGPAALRLARPARLG